MGGRVSPVQSKPRAPSSTRLAPHRKVERGPGMALPFRLLLVLAVAALGVGVLVVAGGGLGRVAAAVGSSLTGFLSDITSTPAPSASPLTVADAPTLEPPDEPYTNQPTVDLVGTVPAAVAGDPDSRIRIYVAIGDGESGPIMEVPVGPSQHFLVPNVQLSKGTNTFTATIVGPTGLESEKSASVAYILDTSKPKITISSPKSNAVVNGKTAKIVGQTQGRSTISIRNATTNATVSGAADGKGAFSVSVPIASGTNAIEVTATDPAGNVNMATLTVRRGTGALLAHLSASFYQVRISKLPEPVTLTVTVTDPDGRPLAGAGVTFTLTVPGLGPITSNPVTTGTDGKATFTPTIAKGATKGQASATVIVSTQDFGNTTDRTVITLQ